MTEHGRLDSGNDSTITARITVFYGGIYALDRRGVGHPSSGLYRLSFPSRSLCKNNLDRQSGILYNPAMHYNTIRYHKRMAALREILGGKCVECGSTEDLHIHHRNPHEKAFTIAREFDRPWEELLVEIAKCELRCGGCHKKEHAAKHGLGMYSRCKCRCEVCREAWSVAHKRYKAAAKARRAAQSG